MQWLDYVFKFISKVFASNAFKKKYKVKTANKLLKILKNNKWQVVDIRGPLVYASNHIKNTINIPVMTFNYNYYKKLEKHKKILLINSNYRSDLNIYRTLKSKGFKTYILYSNYADLIINPEIDEMTKIMIYD
ncbi:rhodanese-like domain-containing protein [Spiroplasma tabanidicola]|uniref:Rhodanese domain-containing protein n=1 Tax=Spiroplasma tabanidicola TaxID=324079 RepID=A0A6I6C9D5_9MOLU|nr:rhodanese-like domain-containing protein [Spiroplasma tabanidicola]QGS51525.1 hypothetical protein STABA_v1c01580 [Spiroplasma tabanidicola]